MKVYFGASTSQFDKYMKYYFAIRDFLVADGHIITRDWIQIYRHELEYEPKKLIMSKADQERIYVQATKAFYESDIMIAENTVPSFSNGHLMTLAIQMKKPVLVMHVKDFIKRRYINRTGFIDGIKSDYFELKEYDMSNYQDIIKSFIKKFEDSEKRHRFHLVIDEVERKYLDWAQFKYNESRTKLIRDAIRNKINSDSDYDNYLKVKN